MTAGGPALVVDGLWVAYRARGRSGWRRRDGHWALRDIDLAVAPGRCLGVIGGNGSGKTTLLQVVTGVIRPTRGRVDVRGRVASLVDLSAGFHRDLTGHENVLIGGVLLGLSRREIRERYDEIVAFSGLPTDALDRRLASYSAGMGLRLGFSLVVSARPDVLLVDEVLAVGDDAFQRQCLARVDELRAGGCAVVIVSHDMAMVRDRCDEVALLDEGGLVHVGDPDVTVARHLAGRDAPVTVPAERALYGERGRTKAARRVKGAS